jgi:hypothetical protein
MAVLSKRVPALPDAERYAQVSDKLALLKR